MSPDEEEETDNVFLNECVDDEINNSDDSQTDMNVKDDTDFSSAPAPKKKKLKKNPKNTDREGEAKQGGLIIHSTSTE